MTYDSVLDDLIERIAAARSRKVPLRIVGGDTKRFYGEEIEEQILDMKAVTGISSYEPSELVITARAGTPLVELEAVLGDRGQWLPFEPPRFAPGNGRRHGRGRIEGRRVSAGAVRDHVLGACMLNGRGELLRFGGQVIKNVAGYDVSRLLAGSLGVLGSFARFHSRYRLCRRCARRCGSRWARRRHSSGSPCWQAPRCR